jgi:hypothetical protein
LNVTERNVSFLHHGLQLRIQQSHSTGTKTGHWEREYKGYDVKPLILTNHAYFVSLFYFKNDPADIKSK